MERDVDRLGVKLRILYRALLERKQFLSSSGVMVQKGVLARNCVQELEVDRFEDIPDLSGEILVYRDNLYFDHHFFDTFITEARASKRARQVALSPDDKSIVSHALPLQEAQRVLERGSKDDCPESDRRPGLPSLSASGYRIAR